MEVISFQRNDHPVEYGKAYGEFRLLDFAVATTELLGDGDVFWKVTGRRTPPTTRAPSSARSAMASAAHVAVDLAVVNVFVSHARAIAGTELCRELFRSRRASHF